MSLELRRGLRADRHEESGGGSGGNGRPLLMVDIDGVISLFGAPSPAAAPSLTGAPSPTDGGRPLEGSFHSIEGIPHFLSSAAAAHLLGLARDFDLVWASGWEEKANEYLPRLLGLPESLPFLRLARPAGGAREPARAERGRADGGAAERAAVAQITHGHWKLESIDRYAGGRPLAWIDDALSPACHHWAATRRAPTLLVQTRPEQGLTARQAQLLQHWARALRQA